MTVEDLTPVSPQILVPPSDAASDDGSPKADTFFVGPPPPDTFFAFARQHVGPALRCTVPILVYAVAVAAVALIVYIPLIREVDLPVRRGNVTYYGGGM